jgi:type IV secretory pathway TraG/TraD family ATPase VirD4
MTAGLVLFIAIGAVATIVVADVLRKVNRYVHRETRGRARSVLATLIVAAAVWMYVSYGAAALTGAVIAASGSAITWVMWWRGGTARTVTRWGEKARRRSGVATPLQVARVTSAWAMHRKARAVRPHLRYAGWLQRWRTPTRELAVELCRAAGMRVWSSVEDVVLIIAGPRRGKTALLGTPVIDAPGAVVTTSTRTDLYDQTRALRAKQGPIWVYNPGAVGDLESTISFDPVHGCDDPTVAIDRAADMIPEREGVRGDSADWDAQSRRVLAAFLHAAGLSEGTRDCHDILRWAANPDHIGDEVHELLQASPIPSFRPAVDQFIGLNPTTRSSITTGILPALQWLHSPAAVASTKGGTPFNVADLVLGKGTVYLLGRHEANTAPLLQALTGYIAREARRLAAQPTFEGACNGRLDPPMRFPLDEAARVCPVPLPDWTGDFGGSGIQLMPVFQSYADMVAKYGEAGAERLLNNSNVLMYIGGNKAVGGLKAFSDLAGDRDETVVTRNGDGDITSTSVRKAPVLSVGQLACLPKWKAIVYTGEMPIVIGRVIPVWKRHPSVSARLVSAWARRVFTLPAPADMSAPAAVAPVGNVSTPVGLPTPGTLPAPADMSGAAPSLELTNVP